MKAGQVGLSTLALLKILFIVSVKDISVVYTLPTTSDARKFVAARVDPLIEGSEYLRAKMRPYGTTLADSTELKRIGNSCLYFRGSWTEQQAQSIDADIVSFDELDFSKPDIRDMYRERLEGSTSLHWEYSFSVPSRPGFGIASLFEKTNQYIWMIRCPRCNRLQSLEFETNIDKAKKIFICRYCQAKIIDNDRRSGVWIPRYPHRDSHGYQFSRLMCPWISAKRILELEERAPTIKHFKNYTLGQPHTEETRLISDQEIWALTGNYEQPSTAESTIVGIDQGDVFHIAIGRLEKIHDTNLYRKKIIALVKAKTPEEVEDILNRYDMRAGIIDAMPNKHTAKQLAEKFRGRLFLAYYSTGLTAKERYDLVRWTPNEATVEIQRTESLDRLMESIYKREFILPRLSENVKVLISHFRNIAVDYQSRYGLTVKIWRSAGADHFVHALNYLNIAFEKAPGYLTGGKGIETSVRYSAGRSHLYTDKDLSEARVPELEELQRRRRKGPILIDVLQKEES